MRGMQHASHRRGPRANTVFCLLMTLLLGTASAWAMTRGTAPTTGTTGDQSLRRFVKAHAYTGEKSDGKVLSVRKGDSTLKFRHGSRKIYAGGVLVWLHEGITIAKGSWRLPNVDANKTLLPMLQPAPFLQQRGYKTILLDPGHGGADPGATSAGGLKEKAVTLDIARHMKKHLENAGYKVLLTRSTDKAVSLKARAAMAKAVKADLFVSIHCNGVRGNTTAKGVETFVLSIPGFNSTNDPAGFQPSRVRYPGNQFDGANVALGYSLHKAMVGENQVEDRGLRRARFLVLKEVACPSALVECGFLSNPKEAGRLSVPYYRKKMALSLARGIDQYLSGVKKSVASRPAISLKP